MESSDNFFYLFLLSEDWLYEVMVDNFDFSLVLVKNVKNVEVGKIFIVLFFSENVYVGNILVVFLIE